MSQENNDISRALKGHSKSLAKIVFIIIANIMILLNVGLIIFTSLHMILCIRTRYMKINGKKFDSDLCQVFCLESV